MLHDSLKVGLPLSVTILVLSSLLGQELGEVEDIPPKTCSLWIQHFPYAFTSISWHAQPLPMSSKIVSVHFGETRTSWHSLPLDWYSLLEGYSSLGTLYDTGNHWNKKQPTTSYLIKHLNKAYERCLHLHIPIKQPTYYNLGRWSWRKHFTLPCCYDSQQIKVLTIKHIHEIRTLDCRQTFLNSYIRE
jgi:hypothetical protein